MSILGGRAYAGYSSEHPTRRGGGGGYLPLESDDHLLVTGIGIILIKVFPATFETDKQFQTLNLVSSRSKVTGNIMASQESCQIL